MTVTTSGHPGSEAVIRWDAAEDGVVTLTIDDPDHRANTMNDAFDEAFAATVARLVAEKEAITGVVVTSGKETFFAGGDLTRLSQVGPDAVPAFYDGVQRIKIALRALETLGRPVVAALNGAALGGGLEIALACHHRVALRNPKAQFGFPEVTLGLLPGAGGIARTVRMLGIEPALTRLLLQGQRLRVDQAVEAGIVDEVAESPQELMAMAKAWIADHAQAAQPWDIKGFRIPGGTPSVPAFAANLPAFPANLRKQLRGAPMPAPHHIMAAAVEGAQVDIDTALRIETRYFVDLARGPVAKNMIKAFWFDLGAINSGAWRPAGFPTRLVNKVTVLGAGMMGAGIAYVSAAAGIDVVLKDVSIEAANKGKDYSRSLLDKQVARGRMTSSAAEAVSARITATDDYAFAAGSDLVIEAVFENGELKRRVYAEVEPAVGPETLLASNTSTLPITGLAEGVHRQADFIGLHFFSPVDKMPLLEIIRGERTSDESVARALDFAAQIRKTPIVVRDSRGFFTSRVIGHFVNEAIAMLGEGLPAQTIEQAATQAGYPVGPLQLADELNLELFAKIRAESRSAAGDSWVAHPADTVVDRMLELGRAGRLRGAGFYDYDETGRRTGLWSGLAAEFPVAGDPATVDLHELSERMLFVESVDAVRCLAEGVLTSVPDANIGSIMGIGYPAWTGGVLQYAVTYPGGLAGYVERAEELARRYGERFSPAEFGVAGLRALLGG